jgi:hypothetical protein
MPHFLGRAAVENAEPSLARTGKAINRRFPKETLIEWNCGI